MVQTARGRTDVHSARNLIIQKIHQSKLNAHYACQVFPAVQPGESATIAYTCTGGRFVDEHYRRQSVLYPTQELNVRLTHGIPPPDRLQCYRGTR